MGNRRIPWGVNEIPSEDTSFEKPDWLGEEVSSDPRYFNSNLVSHPYTTWNK